MVTELMYNDCKFKITFELMPENDIIIDGMKYEHIATIDNISYDSSIYGVLYSYNFEKFMFGLVGCKLDTINHGIVPYETLMNTLTNKYYYI